MTLVIPPGFAQAQLRWTLTGDAEVMISTFGVQWAPLGASPEAAADAIATHWSTVFPSAALANDYTFAGVKLIVGQDGGPPSIAEAPRSIPGTSGAAPLPQNCAVLVKKSTARGGRSGRGRMYLPAGMLQESLVSSNGVLTPAFRSDMGFAMTSFGIAVPMVLLHDSDSPGDLAPDPVTQLTVDSRIATQRRRLR